MKRNLIASCVAFFFLCVTVQAAPDPKAPKDPKVEEFKNKVDISPLRTVAVQDAQTVKTLDSFSRELLEHIHGSSNFEGQDPVFTVLDIAFRPSEYQTANLIKISNLPMRTEFRRIASISSDEQERIVKDATISLEVLDHKDVREMLSALESTDVRKAQACQQIESARRQLQELCFSIYGGTDLFLPVAVIPPAVGSQDATQTWHRLIEMIGSAPDWASALTTLGGKVPPTVPGFTSDQVRPALAASLDLFSAWKKLDAVEVNSAASQLSTALAQINPADYPSPLIRKVEVIYNHLTKMTFPGAACYFVAFVCFLMSTRVGLNNLRLWGLRFFIIGFFVHTIGIAIRWWLTGSWYPPIKNEFESVMFSAWFGALLGLVLELRFGRSIFGSGASFVGWLSLIAIFAVPYVFHTSIGENRSQSNGVLMSYWLYIHVTMVTASYSMIGMAFLLGSWWLIKYYRDFNTLSRVSGRRLEGSASGFDPVIPSSGGVAALSFSQTVARLLFFPAERDQVVENTRVADRALPTTDIGFLATLDACNLVVLQLAFWTLGTGIILGAVWADVSWGRPWAWDPKETFALVTWIAYLIIVHVRVATDDKAWWTSVLSIVGFFLMLFNWIGVNYFLPGLHSYAG